MRAFVAAALERLGTPPAAVRAFGGPGDTEGENPAHGGPLRSLRGHATCPNSTDALNGVAPHVNLPHTPESAATLIPEPPKLHTRRPPRILKARVARWCGSAQSHRDRRSARFGNSAVSETRKLAAISVLVAGLLPPHERRNKRLAAVGIASNDLVDDWPGSLRLWPVVSDRMSMKLLRTFVPFLARGE